MRPDIPTYTAEQVERMLNAQLVTTLENTGMPFKRIVCRGNQCRITCLTEAAALEWSTFLAKSGTVGRIRHGKELNDRRNGLDNVWFLMVML